MRIKQHYDGFFSMNIQKMTAQPRVNFAPFTDVRRSLKVNVTFCWDAYTGTDTTHGSRGYADNWGALNPAQHSADVTG